MAPGLTIRPAEPVDMPAVSALDERITKQSKPLYWRNLFGKYGEGPSDRYFLVAEDQKARLVGFIVGEIRAWEFGSPPCGWVFAINVDPEARLAGIGSSLFSALCARFQAAGVGAVRTMVDRRDHLILSFFRSQGLMAGPSLELEMELPR